MTVRMVPSTGFMTAPYAASDARPSASATTPASTSSASRTTSAMPAQDLREDHPRVAPGPHQRAVADGLARGDQVAVGAGGLVDLFAHRAQREGHVGAGVAVGDRVDVQPVDGLTVGGQGVPIAGHDGAEGGGVELRPGARPRHGRGS